MKTVIRVIISSLFFQLLLFTNPAFSQQWTAAPEIIAQGTGEDAVTGYVFNDTNKNGLLDQGEKGVEGVLVSNGVDWATTDDEGRYEINVRDDMNLTIVQPSGWRVPTDERMVPQFFYIHKEGGTGYDMRFGGLPDTGPAPAAVNFPLTRENTAGDSFTCAVLGDSQAYSNEQVSWLRDGVISDVVDAGL
uniref:metallophosphoesterase N-terminal domain-containing protein n=1 Tax=Rhodohalobacter sp. TaxID=1974210 RepID=UPI00356705D2